MDPEAGNNQTEPTPEPNPANDPTPEPSAAGGAKGTPSQEHQFARIISEAIAPIKEQIAALANAGTEPDKGAGSGDNAEPDNSAAVTEATKALEAMEAKAKSWTVERALLTSDCVDTAALMAHVAMDKIEVEEDGSIKGLDIDSLKKDYPYLFKTPAKVSTSAAQGGQPASAPVNSISDGVGQALKKGSN